MTKSNESLGDVLQIKGTHWFTVCNAVESKIMDWVLDEEFDKVWAGISNSVRRHVYNELRDNHERPVDRDYPLYR